MTRECGKPLVEARMADVFTTLEAARHLVKEAEGTLAPRRIGISNPLLVGRRSRITRHPLGVVGIVAPWNYPLAIPASGVLTALAAGNGVVLKPSEHTPLTGAFIVDLLAEAGAPQGLVGIVQGAGKVGAALVDATDAVVFTGSVATGRLVAEACGRALKPCIVELGGKDPMLVLPGADLDAAARGAVWGAFTNAGQTCAAVERVGVARPDHDALLERLVAGAGALRLGHGLADGVQMGPLINDDAVRRVKDHLRTAVAAGAEVACGGEVRGDLGPRFFEPTVLWNVPDDAPAMRDETFGPLLPVRSYDQLDEAVAWANDSDYGLTASVWGPQKEASAVAARLEAGTVMTNDCLYSYAIPESPWGGWKTSGLGASHGDLGLHALTRWRHDHRVPHGSRSPWHYPYDADLDRMMAGGGTFLHGQGAAKRVRPAPGLMRAWMKRRR
ncbi:MAG: aldehyde dehydrogenase family protein [Thermoplasmatota archaeon]